MGVIAEGILRGCQELFTPVSLGYPLSVFNKKLYPQRKKDQSGRARRFRATYYCVCSFCNWRANSVDSNPKKKRENSSHSRSSIRFSYVKYSRSSPFVTIHEISQKNLKPGVNCIYKKIHTNLKLVHPPSSNPGP